MNDMIPTLSICMAGRDDQYMSDFRYRITTTINSFAYSLSRLRNLEEVEILVTDWGSNTPLSESLELSSDAAEICRFLYVPQTTIKETQGGEDYYHTTRSFNVALRRARGRFVLLTNADQILTVSGMDSLLRFLKGKIPAPVPAADVLMVVPRVQVPWQFFQLQPSVEDWDKYLFVNEFSLEHQPTPPQAYFFGSAGGFVFSSERNARLRGLHEDQSGWGFSDIEFCFRATRQNPYLYLSTLGIYLFHMQHPPVGDRSRSVQLAKNTLTWTRREFVNDTSWGLADHPVIEQTSAAHSRRASLRGAADRGTTSESVLHDPQSICEEIGGAEISRHVLHAVRSLDRAHWRLDASELGALSLLAWYSLNNYPRAILRLGKVRPHDLGVVAAACPGIEIVNSAFMTGEIPGNDVQDTVRSFQEVGLRGYFQVLNGDVSDALQNVKKITESVDLIHLNLDDFEEGFSGIQQLASLLKVRGALVINASQIDGTTTAYNEVRRTCNELRTEIFRCEDGRSLMIMRLQGQADSLNARNDRLDFTFHVNPELALAARRRRSSESSLSTRIARALWRKIKRAHDRYNEHRGSTS